MNQMNHMTSPSKTTQEINPVWEAEIKKVLDELWKNRFNLSLKNVELLRRLSNKKY
jgi:putative aminopeptidase FrvX